MNRYRILTGIFCLLATGNVLAEEADTLKVVDVEEITVIAAPKENRKLREQPAAVTLLSQQDMQNAQVNSIKNLTSVVPNMFIPDYGSRLTSAVYIRGIGSRINTPLRRILCRQYTLYRQVSLRLQLCRRRAHRRATRSAGHALRAQCHGRID